MSRFLITFPAIAFFALTSACLSTETIAAAQSSSHEVIDVWPGDMPAFAPASERAKQKEFAIETRDRYNWPDTVLLNVTKPSMRVVRPKVASNGAAIVVVPGGGFRVLAYANEGERVADWFASRGFTAFILKYRLNPMPNDPSVLANFGAVDGAPADSTVATDTPRPPPAMRLEGPFEKDALADGVQAIKTVRARAREFDIDPNRVGIVGFSAGGSVASNTAISADASEHPDFVGIIYSRVSGEVPKGAPPAFFCRCS